MFKDQKNIDFLVSDSKNTLSKDIFTETDKQ